MWNVTQMPDMRRGFLTTLILFLLALAAPPYGPGAENGANPALPLPDMLGEESSASTFSATVGLIEEQLSAADFPNAEETIRKRLAELKELEAEIDKKVSYLEGLRADIIKRKGEYDAAQKKLDETYNLADKKRQKRIKDLAPVYEGMKPENAAVAIAGSPTTGNRNSPEALTNQEALMLLESMDVKKASKVLDEMAKNHPDKAVELTKALFKITSGN
mgnify:CR=1 FL=1